MSNLGKSTKKSSSKRNRLTLKKNEGNKCVQTITSMFKRQNDEQAQSSSRIEDSPGKSVQFIKVEYSSKSSLENEKNKVETVSRKLSLRRSSSKQSDSDLMDTESKSLENDDELLCPKTPKEENDDCCNISSASDDKQSGKLNRSLSLKRPNSDKKSNTTDKRLKCDYSKSCVVDTDEFVPKTETLEEAATSSESVQVAGSSNNTDLSQHSDNKPQTPVKSSQLSLKMTNKKTLSRDKKPYSRNKKQSNAESPKRESHSSISFHEDMDKDDEVNDNVGGDDNDDKHDKSQEKVCPMDVASLRKEPSEVSLADMDDVLDDPEVKEYRTPYYLESFRVIIQSVLGDKDNAKLFNEDDMLYVSTFNSLSESAQKLFIRLFGRKSAWLPTTRIKYKEIGEDLTPVIKELVDGKLLMPETELNDLETALRILSAGDMKTLAKSYHINTPNKKDTVTLLMKKSKQNTIGSMFKVSGLQGTSTMLNRAKKLLGGCVHILEEPRSVFLRMLMLFSLNDTILDEDNASGSSNQLFQMLRVKIGDVVYPSYTVNKQTPIFADRGRFLQFAEASNMESDILSRIEKKDYDGAYDVYIQARQKFDEKFKDKSTVKHDKSLPEFLRSYTFCGVCVRVLNQGVELLQRRKDYTGAVALLELLLSQHIYCIYYRGHWSERLAINYDAHLKNPSKALKVIKKALSDKYVRTGHRLALYQRAEKICTAPKSKFSDQMTEFHHDKVTEPQKQVIEGLVLSDNIPGMKYKFIMEASGSEGDVTFCGVEQLVLDHYLMNGYTDGLHAEGGILSYLLTIFFWDALFCDIADVFHSPHQAYPLDFHSDHFYLSRRSQIDNILQKLQSSSEEELLTWVANVWNEHQDTVCGMKWEAFKDLEHFQGLVACFGGKVIAGIMERIVKNTRGTRGGFPDLTLWNTETKTVKISEVKGPGDRLSYKQILWIDYLTKLGLDAEVCHVKAVGSKRLKHSI